MSLVFIRCHEQVGVRPYPHPLLSLWNKPPKALAQHTETVAAGWLGVRVRGYGRDLHFLSPGKG